MCVITGHKRHINVRDNHWLVFKKNYRALTRIHKWMSCTRYMVSVSLFRKPLGFECAYQLSTLYTFRFNVILVYNDTFFICFFHVKAPLQMKCPERVSWFSSKSSFDRPPPLFCRSFSDCTGWGNFLLKKTFFNWSIDRWRWHQTWTWAWITPLPSMCMYEVIYSSGAIAGAWPFLSYPLVTKIFKKSKIETISFILFCWQTST